MSDGPVTEDGKASRVAYVGTDRSGRAYRAECYCGWTSLHRRTEDEAELCRRDHERNQHVRPLGVLAVACPLCGAATGDPCTASTGSSQHVRSHAERKRAYAAVSS